MVSGTHRLLLREGRNNRSNPDFQTFFEGFIFFYGAVLSLCTQRLMNIHDIQSLPFIPSIHH